MFTRRAPLTLASFSLLVAATATLWAALPADHPQAALEQTFEAPQARGPGRGGAAATFPGVFTRRVDPHWFANNAQFWYRNDLPGGAKEFILVHADTGTRQQAFDHAKLAAALSKAAVQNYAADKLPFDAIDVAADDRSVRFTVGTTTWRCDLATYAVEKDAGAPVPSRAGAAVITEEEPELALLDDDIFPAPQAGGGRGGAGGAGRGAGAARGAGRGRGGGGPVTSPDGKWTASVQNNNIVLGPVDSAPASVSTDGQTNDSYTNLSWSPDSSTLVAFRIQPGDHREVYRVQSSPPARGATGGGVGRTVLQTSVYALPGDKFDSYELNLFDAATKKQTKPEIDRIDMSANGGDPNPTLRWRPDGYHFTFEKYDRGHQRVRLVEGDAHTGKLRNIIDEQTKTFIWTAHADGEGWRMLTYLPNDELLYSSEVDGWRHYYLIDGQTPPAGADAKTPEMKHITQGQWVVRGVNSARDTNHPAIDTRNLVLYFTASGIYPNQDPYLIHYGHVNFDGTGLVWETAGDGNHTVSYSPDYQYIIDSYDRADWPGATELRRVSDGKLVVALEKTNADNAPWMKPEVFTAKGRDGTTDIWGLFYRPANFDPTKKYPVIENVYAGPHGNFVPKAFAMHPPRGSHMIGDELGFDELLLNAGYLIVHIDGMGTAHRSRAFHDVSWRNLADAGFSDRILWMKALAAKYPFLDLDRVGVFGTSAGGQSTGAALLFHPEFYKVGVANSGCHDNRMDKASWNEQWMGYPVGPWYGANSNIDNAAKLRGHLQLVVGELDTNVPPESTFRFVDALIKANRDFELIMVPGADHGAILPNETLVQTKLVNYFNRYLKGVEPANPNTR